MTTRILVIGGSGQVGTELCRHAWPAGVAIYAPPRDALDVTDEAAVQKICAEGDWDGVINTAAYTAVDRAEGDVASAWRLNALAPAILAATTRHREIPLVQISTDYVFDGASEHPYVETDAVAPVNVYGASKEGGEQAVRTANPRHVIVRAAWVVSAHRTNFVKTMLRLAEKQGRVRVVDDQFGCPTAAKDLAGAVAVIALRLAEDAAAPTGTYHVVNRGETSWCGFAREIVTQFNLRRGHKAVVEAISTSEFPTPAQRPLNSRLSTAKVEANFNIRMRSWQDGLADILDELIGPDSLDERMS